MTKRVAILTTFYEAESGYSLIAVAETQIRMLLDHGYEPVVIVQENFQSSKELWRPETIDLRAVLPALKLTDGIAPEFEGRVGLIKTALSDALADVDICITHDIILQSFFKEHNAAMRAYAKERPEILWLHWIHSMPTPGGASYPDSLRHTPPPGYIVYPNETDKPRVCQAYGMQGQEHRVQICRAGHAIDPLRVWPYDELTRVLADKADLLSGDIVAVYPARLDRGKQPEKIIRLMAGILSAGYTPRLLVIDWQSMGKSFQAYIDELLDLARGLGLAGSVSFASRLDDRCSQGVPRRIVQELMDLSNVYIHPSRAETYSFVVHEAMLRGNLVVLNHDLAMMREVFGNSAIYFDFGSDFVNREYKPSEQAFWNDEAVRLLAEYRMNRSLVAKTKAMREWSPRALWRDFQQLLYLEAVA